MEKNSMRAKEIKRQFKKGLLIIMGIAVLYGSNVVTHKINNYFDTKNYVEPYCAVKYSHNVEKYKTCKDLTSTQLILQLTEQLQKENTFETIDLPMIKM